MSAACPSPAPLTIGERGLVALLAVALSLAMGARSLPDALDGGYVNPDSTMRLARLADTLRAGSPVDLLTSDQSGIAAPLHWSHLLDFLLLALAAPLRLLFPGSLPEAADAPLPASVHWAAAASGPLWVAALALALLWAVAPFADRAWRWFVAPALALAIPVANYALPGEVTHHLLLAVVATMAAGWAVRAPTRGAVAGWRLGLWCGVGLWFSPQTFPFSLLAFGLVGLFWLLAPGAPPPRRALLAVAPGLLAVLLLALAIDPGTGSDWIGAVDRISLVYVALAVALGVIGAGCWALDRTAVRAGPRAAGGILLVLLAIGTWVAAFLIVRRGTDAPVGSAAALAIFDRTTDMRAVTTLDDGLRILLPGLLACAVLAWWAWRQRSLVILYAVLCGLVLVGLAMWHRRFATDGAVLAAAVLVLLLSRISRAPWGAGLAGTAARLGSILLLLGLPLAPDTLAFEFSATSSNAAPAAAAACSTRRIAALLAPLAGQVVLSDVNESPDLLYRTRVLTVGSRYHRAAPGFVRLVDAWRSPGTTATEPPEVAATHAAFVLACPGRPRTAMVAGLPPDTLFDVLNRNAPPPWLQPLAADPAGHVLYRVRPPP